MKDVNDGFYYQFGMQSNLSSDLNEIDSNRSAPLNAAINSHNSFPLTTKLSLRPDTLKKVFKAFVAANAHTEQVRKQNTDFNAHHKAIPMIYGEL